MKKIINGRKYDTETAKEVASTCGGEGPRDFSFFEETLYCKKTGEFFLAGHGGAASKYAKSCGQRQWCGGEAIIPLTEQEAKTWCERALDVDEYEAIFGEVEE